MSFFVICRPVCVCVCVYVCVDFYDLPVDFFPSSVCKWLCVYAYYVCMYVRAHIYYIEKMPAKCAVHQSICGVTS